MCYIQRNPRIFATMQARSVIYRLFFPGQIFQVIEHPHEMDVLETYQVNMHAPFCLEPCIAGGGLKGFYTVIKSQSWCWFKVNWDVQYISFLKRGRCTTFADFLVLASVNGKFHSFSLYPDHQRAGCLMPTHKFIWSLEFPAQEISISAASVRHILWCN